MDALVGAAGILETSIKGNSRICDIWPSTYMTCLCFQSNFSKTARNFLTILRLLLEENISFHINLISQLDALVGEAGIPRNIDKRKQPYMRYMAISLYDIHMFAVKFLKNGSKFFNNTSSSTRAEYFLSYKPSQPIGRASLWDWRS